MKVLLLHPDDSLEAGPWAASHWDLVVDLGWSGRHHYEQASRKYSNRVLSFYDLLSPEEHGAQLRSMLRVGLGEFVDAEGLDWWELFSPFPYARLDEILMMAAVHREISSDDEVCATRSHPLAQVLTMLSGREINYLRAAEVGKLSAVLHRYSRLARTFGPAQLTEIALDKWDSDFRLRRLLSPKKKPLQEEAVLLPSAYGNVSRSQAAYARMLPGRQFLQVATRKNGRIEGLPRNVEVRSLASYAPLPQRSSTAQEDAQLRAKWSGFEQRVLNSREEFRIANELGVFGGFASFMRNGLRVRDAWMEVLKAEPVRSVLSADENNPYTRIPVLLARSRGTPTVFCDHGALNMSFAVREPCSGIYLVRGEMARDYLLRISQLPSERVVVGAAGEAGHVITVSGDRDCIVVFSEAYELFGGRVEDFYREIFPRLCSTARDTGRRVVLKLHPFESVPARRRVLQKVLSAEDVRSVEIISGPLTSELMERVWCGITVESSVACDCALQGVPCFLCHWFESSWYEYGRQFAKFGAGYLLDSPEELWRIPSLVEEFRSTPEMRGRLMTAIRSERLEELLSGGKAVREGSR